ncbi:hypothetical protein ABOC32_28935 (plasmid) [Pseudomonas sp. WOUb67]|uniref:hypothetical protein n=1 Tax=Pseudomonas sp. WOUb67 TaxID=3161136 RepID=UPI003CE70B4A
MQGAIKAGLAGLVVMAAAHADVGREEALDAAVRQFAAKLEAEWQQCLKETRDKNHERLRVMRFYHA